MARVARALESGGQGCRGTGLGAGRGAPRWASLTLEAPAPGVPDWPQPWTGGLPDAGLQLRELVAWQDLSPGELIHVVFAVVLGLSGGR